MFIMIVWTVELLIHCGETVWYDFVSSRITNTLRWNCSVWLFEQLNCYYTALELLDVVYNVIVKAVICFNIDDKLKEMKTF